MTANEWDELTAFELRTAAKVARAAGGLILPSAAEAWEKRAANLEGEATTDAEFFDVLYQGFARTTGAEDCYWMPIDCTEDEYLDHNNYSWDVTAVPVNEVDGDFSGRRFIGSFKTEEDAAFITAMHGALPDLIRALHDAQDEAERKDVANDIAQEHLADALMENQGLREQIRELEEALNFEGNPR